MAQAYTREFKVEAVRLSYQTDRPRRKLFEYMELFYNRERLHLKLGLLSPAALEQQHHQLVNESPSPVH